VFMQAFNATFPQLGGQRVFAEPALTPLAANASLG
jgi:hypothetical protein